MQIYNNTQCPCPKSTSFGMALKIKPSAADYLKTQPRKALETLEKLGDEFKDYKHWDLVVDKDGYHAVGKYHLDGQYTEIGCPKDYSIYSDSFSVPVKSEKFADAGKEINKFMNYQDKTAASVGYANITNANSGIDRMAAFIRELEKLSAQKAYDTAAKNAAEQEHLGKINDLICKYREVE